jgi:hypothetical protein
MVGMAATTLQSTLLAISLLTGLPWIRSGSAAPPTSSTQAAAGDDAPDRVVLLTTGDPAYRALAIPRSYKTNPGAGLHLLVFRGGLCIRDHGLSDSVANESSENSGPQIVEQSGTTERAFVGQDGRAAAVVGTRYDSRVDVTPGQTSTANDTVTGDTTVTLVDPAHPDGRWRVTLEDSRWVKDVVVLADAKGVVLTSFVPRHGPTDMRVLDATGHETIRVPETSARSQRIEASPDGGYVAAEVAFRDNPLLPERGVIVFDLAHGTQWTYSWRYGSDDEPVSWTLQTGGVLAVKLPGATRRFDATGRRL